MTHELGVIKRPVTRGEAENVANIIHWCLYTAPDDSVLEHVRRSLDGE